MVAEAVRRLAGGKADDADLLGDGRVRMLAARVVGRESYWVR